MADRYYEHHVAIRKDKLCPFKLAATEDAFESICNWHENIEILVITKGSGTVRYGSRELAFSAGDIIVVNSGTIHHLKSKGGMSYYYLIIDESFCVENGIFTDKHTFTPIFRSKKTHSLFENAVRALNLYYGDREDTLHLKASRARLAVLALLIDICENRSAVEEYIEKEKKPSEEYVKRVMAYMSENYAEAITLDALARLCGITKCHLAREFKLYTGQTLLTYLNTVRCKNAEMCLRDGKTVTDTTYECGFESVSYFSRTYKKIIGVSPSKTAKES